MRSVVSFTGFILLSLLLSLPNVAEAADPPSAPISVASDTVEKFLIQLPSSPPGRLRVLFSKDDSTEVRMVEFDPYLYPRLNLSVILKKGTWHVSSWADPIRDPGDFSKDYAWKITSCTKKEPNPYSCTLTSARGDEGSLKIQQISEPKLEDASQELATAIGGTPPLSGRAFGGNATAAVDELLSTVAEVVVERARGRATKVLSDRLTALLCDELKIDTTTKSALYGSSASMEDRLFSSTCKRVQHIRIEDLLGSGRELLNSIQSDFILLTMNVLKHQVVNWISENLAPEPASAGPLHAGAADNALKTAADHILKEMIDQLTRQQSSGKLQGSLDAQRLLLVFAKQKWSTIRNEEKRKNLKTIVAALQVAFVVMQQCHQQSCDVRMVRTMLEEHANLYNKKDKDQDGEWKTINEKWSDLDHFVLQGMAVLNPPKGSTSAGQMAIATELVFEFTEKFRKSLEEDKPVLKGWEPVLKSSRGLIVAALRGDLQQMIVPASELMTPLLGVVANEGHKDALKNSFDRVAKLLVAAGSYISSYVPQDQATPEQQKAQQQARKRAIESLIDEATRRSERDGAWVLSLGVGAGLLGGGQWLPVDGQPAEAKWLLPQLSLPVGLTVQRLPDRRSGNPFWRYFGPHFQLSALDIAQYVSYDQQGKLSQPTWSSAFSLGGQVGVVFGSFQTPVIIAADVRYSPTLFSRLVNQNSDGGDSTEINAAGALRFGLFLGTYFPLFDFN